MAADRTGAGTQTGRAPLGPNSAVPSHHFHLPSRRGFRFGEDSCQIHCEQEEADSRRQLSRTMSFVQVFEHYSHLLTEDPRVRLLVWRGRCSRFCCFWPELSVGLRQDGGSPWFNIGFYQFQPLTSDSSQQHGQTSTAVEFGERVRRHHCFQDQICLLHSSVEETDQLLSALANSTADFGNGQRMELSLWSSFPSRQRMYQITSLSV